MLLSRSPYSSLQENVPAIKVSQALVLCNSLLQELSLSVEGEVANLSISRGKFAFFDLKDEEEECRIGCFMMTFQMNTPLEDGMRVVVQGKPGIYQKNGSFRLTVTKAEPKGAGSLKRGFELLCAKLELEGLFASERKRPLPRYPQHVGIVSSKDAAGYGDFIKIASTRLPGILFYFVHVAVQGQDSELEICQAFDYLNSHHSLDAIVLLRGGGSMEDLHAFNSEPVARAISRSKAPVLVGVGHERDITIADYAADVRAATPSNAAQILLPSQEEVEQYVKSLTHTSQRHTEHIIQEIRQTISIITNSTKQYIQFKIEQSRQKVEYIGKTILVTSPLEVLKRGYSITKKKDGTLISSKKQIVSGETIITYLQDGVVESTSN